ncbi:MAG: ATP-binding protein [Gemmatimonadaceae bacterium]
MSDQFASEDGDSHAAEAAARAPIATFRVSAQGRLLLANPAALDMLGYGHDADPSEIDFTGAVLSSRDREVLLADAAPGALERWSDQTWRRSDGRALQARVAARAVRGPDEELLYIEVVAEDMSERLRLDDIARRDERMALLGRALSGVAHEINNPLAAIIGFAQILLKTEQTAPNRHALETVLSEARRAARIVKDLLTLARRREPSSRAPVDLIEMARAIIDRLRSQLQSQHIRANVEPSVSSAVINGDATQLEQVIRHLVVNAIQSLEARAAERPREASDTYVPTLSLRSELQGRHVRMEVCDNGIGIAARDLPHIWDPFWTSREEGKGTGLGLAVVHGIVAAHGGTIDVRSDPESGTCFTITLPLANGTSESADGDLTTTGPATGMAARPLDILIVDDEQSLRTLLKRIFADRGHAVVTAANGAQALRLAEQTSFDVVVCDLRMPTMDGRDVIQHMSALPTCVATRFVLSTGDVTGISAPAGHPAPRIDAVVAKPYNVSLLVEIVEGTVPS